MGNIIFQYIPSIPTSNNPIKSYIDKQQENNTDKKKPNIHINSKDSENSKIEKIKELLSRLSPRINLGTHLLIIVLILRYISLLL